MSFGDCCLKELMQLEAAESKRQKSWKKKEGGRVQRKRKEEEYREGESCRFAYIFIPILESELRRRRKDEKDHI